MKPNEATMSCMRYVTHECKHNVLNFKLMRKVCDKWTSQSGSFMGRFGEQIAKRKFDAFKKQGRKGAFCTMFKVPDKKMTASKSPWDLLSAYLYFDMFPKKGKK